MKSLMLILLAGLLPAITATAKVDLVTLPTRDSVQMTIYNSADMTLIRESRLLTLSKGANKLQFSWANTLIDPTSLELFPKEHADKISILELAYPPRANNAGVWTIQSEVSGKVPVEITYLTSGLSWRAFYMALLSSDEQTMRLEGYVRVANFSGEDYENAQTRLIVGKVHLIDEIATLARRQPPYGRPGEGIRDEMPMPSSEGNMMLKEEMMAVACDVAEAAPKEIKKEGLSEYFLYTIEGQETIPNTWAKRLPSFDANDIPVINRYKYEEERYGAQVIRFLGFKNDKKHKLGETPIPDGDLKAFRQLDGKGHLSYEGMSSFKYIPVDEDAELNLGPVENVVVEPKVMDFKTDRYRYDDSGNISGWDEIRTVQIKVRNTRDLPVTAEVTRNFNSPHWELDQKDRSSKYEKVDLDSVKFTLELKPMSEKVVEYVITTHLGRRAE
jgi:hypothetical protein